MYYLWRLIANESNQIEKNSLLFLVNFASSIFDLESITIRRLSHKYTWKKDSNGSFSKNLCDKKLHLIIGSISYSLISIFDHQYELPVRVSIESYFFHVSRQVVKYHRKLYRRIECVTVGTRRLVVGNPSSNLGHVVSRVA